MSSQYNGQAKNTYGSLPTSLSINTSTNSTPIVVTTTATHGLASGDSVVIGGHLGNTAANGRWIVTVLSSYTFSLAKIDGTNSVGNGAGTTSGTVYPMTLGATYQQPSDGDDEDGASVDVSLEALGDRTAYLGRQVAIGAYQPVLVQSQSIADTEPPTMGSIGTITGAFTSWQPLKVGGVTQVWTIPNLCKGDVVVLDFTSSAAQNLNANALVALFTEQVSAGGSLSTLTRVGGSGQILPWSGTGAGASPLHLKGVVTMGNFNGDPGGSLLVVVQGYITNSYVVTLYSEAELAYTVMRPNG